MSFSELNAAMSDLRNSVRSFVGEEALGEITARPPAGDADEASFLRLASWSYVLLFEAGRVSIPYLLELPSEYGAAGKDAKTARQLVHALRTWSFHNLGFTSGRDVLLAQTVQRWFLKNCGVNPPNDEDAWRRCCQALCGEVGLVIAYCQGAVTLVLSAPDDGRTAIADLRRRIERAWPAHEFDKLADDAAIRLGIRIDGRKFRETHLTKWREFLESLPDADDPEMHMIRMIERDLLEHAAFVLPIDGNDVMASLDLDPGPNVGVALRHARELYQSGIRDREQLLARLVADQ